MLTLPQSMKKQVMLGGQAVIEGVMIKSPNYVTISVRNEKGKIVYKKEKLKKVDGPGEI